MASETKSLAKIGMFVSVVTAFVTVPLFFNMNGYQSFVLDKALLLQWIGMILLVSLLGFVVMEFRQRRQQGQESVLPRELVLALFLPLALYTLDIFVGSVFTINRYNTLIGSYDRMQGLLTFLAYVALFVSVYLLALRRETLHVLLDVLIGVSIPVALYGLMQHFGIGTVDAALGMRSLQNRIVSTLGNPIFLADYLTILFFPTLYRLVELFMRSEEEWSENLGKHMAVAAVYLLALITDLMAIVLSQSRGASLSLVVVTGLLVFLGVLLYKPRGYRPLLYGTIFSLVVLIPLLVTVGVVMGGKTSPADGSIIHQLPLLRRLSVQDRDTRARLEIWESAMSFLTPGNDLRFPPDFHPDPHAFLHRLVGYGLDTQEDIFPQFLPPSEFWRSHSVDRAHNGLLDVWITSGVLGLLFYLWIFMGAIYLLFKRLFIGLRSAAMALALGLVIGTVLLGGAGLRFLDGSFRLVPAFVPLLTVIGILIAALVLDRLVPESGPDEPMASRLPLLFLFGGLMAYSFNQSTGIPTSASNMVFWSLLAMYVALVGHTHSSNGRKTVISETGSISIHCEVIVVVVMVLVFFVLSYILIFYVGAKKMSLWAIWRSNFGFIEYDRRPFYGWPKGGILLLSAGSLSTLLAQHTHVSKMPRNFWGVVFRLFGIAALSFLFFSLGLSYWYARMTTAETLFIQGTWVSTFPRFYYLSLLVIMGAALIWAAGREKLFSIHHNQLFSWRASLPIFLVTVVVAGSVLLRYVLPTSIADTYFKYAVLLTGARAYRQAEQIFPKAVDLVGYRSMYYYFYAQTLFQDIQQHPDENPELLLKMNRILTRARDADPLNSDSWKNLATLYLFIYETSQGQDKAALKKAAENARISVLLRPHNAPRRVFYAKILFKAGQEREALRQLDQARSMDPTYRDTYMVASGYFLTQGKRQEALSYLQAWLEQDPRDVEVLLQVALLYVQMQDGENADAYIQKALSVAPRDYSVLYTAATLYRDVGRLSEALEIATRARAAASSDAQRKQVEDLINALQKEVKEHTE